MRTIYVDAEFKCHVTNQSNMISVNTDFFDGKCDTFIEGYRFIPFGESWTRSDGEIFHGEMISPWKLHSELIAIQKEYEKLQNEFNSSYTEGVNSI